MTCCGGSDDEVNTRTTVPTRKDGCTDVLWLAVYVAFWFILVFIAAFAIVYGNPLRLVNGYDSFGNTCGSRNNEKIGNLSLSGLDTTNKRFLFYLNMKDIKHSLKVCVEKCPDRNLESQNDIKDFYIKTGSLLCRYDFKFNGWTGPNDPALGQIDLEKHINSHLGPCPPLPVYASDPVLNRCIPRPVKDILVQIISSLYDVLNSWDAVEKVLGDLYMTWREILALSFLAFVLSLIMVSFLHLLASIVAWIFMIFVSIASVGGTCFLWYTYARIRKELNATPANQILEESVQNESAFLAYSIIATIITVILLLLVCALTKRIQFLADLFEESAHCLQSIPGLFLQPFITFIALLAFFAFWVTVIVCLATSSYPGVKPFLPFASFTDESVMKNNDAETTTLKPRNNISLAGFKQFTWVEFVDPMWVRYFWWIYLIALVWVPEFILACQQMVIAGAVSQWYFNRRSSRDITPVRTAMERLVCQHLGSVAKGSLLITIFKIPRLILMYLHAKLHANKETSSVARCCLKCCICCLYCFENCIRFLNQNAYTVVAMEGVNFCDGARIAFTTLGSNALRLVTINSVGDFILFLGKCFVTAVTGSVGLVFLQNNGNLHFYAIPTLVVCIFAFFISHCVLSLYEVVIDTMFLCVCEDERINPEGGHWQTSSIARRETRGTELQPMATQ
ncbi:choline transporter-like 1 [Schistocerca nitens]|uniref:choline transporter-like 1 n=1 Tax=Schistocerca nitens TaxID=7011 RepID=UPI002118CC46|nr:choline transporter-like 1 [Schistocerca nitens]